MRNYHLVLVILLTLQFFLLRPGRAISLGIVLLVPASNWRLAMAVNCIEFGMVFLVVKVVLVDNVLTDSWVILLHPGMSI